MAGYSEPKRGLSVWVGTGMVVLEENIDISLMITGVNRLAPMLSFG